MKFRKHMFSLSKSYDLGYEQCRVDTNNPHYEKPATGSIEPLQGPVAWPVREFDHKGTKTRIFGPESRK